MSRKRNTLFEDVEEDTSTQLSVNKNFAEKFEHKKRREELSRLEEKYGKKNLDDTINSDGDKSSDSESEDEDEDGELLTPSVDAQILTTLGIIRARNEKIYNPNEKFFDEKDLKRAEKEWRKRQKQNQRPVTVKEYRHEQLLKEANGEEVEEEEMGEVEMPFAKQQEKLKQDIKNAFNFDRETEEDFLKIRPKTEDDVKREDEEYRAFLLENLSKSKDARESMHEWLERQDGHSKDIGENEAFLIDYVLNRGWVEKDRKRLPSYDQIIRDDEEDEKVVEKADEYEAQLNFRFEQPGADKVQTFPRKIEGSIRVQDTRRKETRKARNERKQAERLQQTEELKRLKNLKKAEHAQKMERLRQVCGKSSVPEDVLDDFEEDFDPVKHDAKMSRLFNDDYFKAEEHKPTFSESEDEPALQTKATMKATKSVKKALKKGTDPRLLDELYKLDYEDKIDGIACRFKYHSVQPTSFGLDPVEIIAADDANLNAHVSIKKLAPYLPLDKQAQDIHKLSDKRRLYQFRTRLLESLRQNPQ